jgi:hypothetical protein
MRITIYTAHGYLSFQPDGRIEYRAVAGPWEELEIEGLVLAREPDADLDPPDVPGETGPTPAMSAQYVAAVKQQLERAGENLIGPCGAFKITARVAWGLRGAGIGLLSKPGGNQCNGFATDVLVLPNHTDIVDILSDGGGQNVPSWYIREHEVDPDRWRAPVAP